MGYKESRIITSHKAKYDNSLHPADRQETDWFSGGHVRRESSIHYQGATKNVALRSTLQIDPEVPLQHRIRTRHVQVGA